MAAMGNTARNYSTKISKIPLFMWFGGPPAPSIFVVDSSKILMYL
jgi:hypothetical protein